MTVNDLARAAGVPPQTTAAIVCGMHAQPSELERIADALCVGLDEIAVGVVLKPNRRAGGIVAREYVPPLPAGQVRVDTVRFAEAVARSVLNINQLAERAGVSPDTVRSIQRGAVAHKAGTVEKLADALGVAAYHIIQREGKA